MWSICLTDVVVVVACANCVCDVNPVSSCASYRVIRVRVSCIWESTDTGEVKALVVCTWKYSSYLSRVEV